MTTPKDLNEMYVLASRRVVVKKSQGTSAGASFLTVADKNGKRGPGKDKTTTTPEKEKSDTGTKQETNQASKEEKGKKGKKG